MHDIIVSILLGIVEGLSEFLPISSTGHLLVAERLLGLGDEWEAFTVVIQLGAILAVVVIYFNVFWNALLTLPSSAESRRFALGILLALLPSVVAGVALKKFLDAVLLNPATAMPFIAACWIVGGIIILVFERIAPPPRWFEGDKLPLLKAFQIGCCQVLSIIPGVSRSGATILGGELLGVERKAATLFTFYLAVPTMMGATILELHKKSRRPQSPPKPRHRHRLCRLVRGRLVRDPPVPGDRQPLRASALRLVSYCDRSGAGRLATFLTVARPDEKPPRARTRPIQY